MTPGTGRTHLHLVQGGAMKILIVDDHPLIQEALQHVLTALDPALELIQAQDASEAHAALSHEPDTDLIVLDLALPGCDGFELLADLRQEWPELLVQGKPNKLICRDLRLSEGTVKVHVSAILRAFNVRNRTQVVIELARRGVRLDASVARADGATRPWRN